MDEAAAAVPPDPKNRTAVSPALIVMLTTRGELGEAEEAWAAVTKAIAKLLSAHVDMIDIQVLICGYVRTAHPAPGRAVLEHRPVGSAGIEAEV